VKEAKPLHVVSSKRERVSSSSECLENGENGHDEYLEDGDEYELEHANIVRADEVQEEELPQEAFTKNMLAKFQSLEDTNMEPPTPESSQQKMKIAKLSVGPGPMQMYSTRAVSPTHLENNGHLDEREQPEGLEQTEQYNDYDYNQEVDSGEYENNPNRNSDVIREEDILTDDLPEQGTTRNLLAKFQSMHSS